MFILFEAREEENEKALRREKNWSNFFATRVSTTDAFERNVKFHEPKMHSVEEKE